MPELLAVVALATIPAAANLGGGLLAELRLDRTLLLAFHGPAGIVLAVVAIELMPELLAETTPLLPVVAFLAGGLFLLAVDIAVSASGEGSAAAKACRAPSPSGSPLPPICSVTVS